MSAGAVEQSDVLGSAEAVRRYARRSFMSRQAHLELDGAEPARVSGWQGRLDRLAPACGCREGSIAVFAVLAALLVQIATGPTLIPAHGPFEWLAALFAAAVVGKLAGLIAAALRVRSVAGSIAEWEAGR